MSITYPTDRSTYEQSGTVVAQRVTASLEAPVGVSPSRAFQDTLSYASLPLLLTATSSNPNLPPILDISVPAAANGNFLYAGNFAFKTRVTEFDASSDAYGNLNNVETTPLLQADFNYNVNSEVFVTSSTSGSISTLSGNMVVACSGGAGSYAQLETKHYVRIRPGQGAGTRFSAVFTPNVSGTQIYGWGSDTDGYFVGMSGSQFGILHRSHGVDEWTLSSSFNIDTLASQDNIASGFGIDPSKGNVFDIQAQWLGYGSITFNVVNPITGKFMPFHRIKYANEHQVPSTRFNSEKVFARVEGVNGGSGPIEIKGASLLTYVEGKPVYSGPTFATFNSKTNIATETNILTLQNKSTFQGLTNKVAIKFRSLGFAVEGTKPAIIRLYKNATLGGTPSYTDIDVNNSITSYDTAGTTVSGGTLIAAYAVGKSSSNTVYGDDLDLWLYAGETLTITAYSAANTDATVSIRWVEDH